MFGLNLKIGTRIYAGCFAIVLILVVSASITLMEIKDIETRTTRVNDLRVPTSEASQSISRDIYASLAALRGWMLTGNAGFKGERAAIWQNIEKTSGEMDYLSKNWTNPDNLVAWESFKDTLAEFKMAQRDVEALSQSPDQFPATKILTEQAAPQAAAMVSAITKIIDIENTLPPKLTNARAN